MNDSPPRTTTDLLVLMIAGTICLAVLATGATIGVLELKDSTIDTSKVVQSLSDVINTLIGLLAGFLAGRSEALIRRNGNGNGVTRP